MENCVFCKIVSGEIPSYTIFENDTIKVFLDISQTTPGHILMIPKKHITSIFDYSSEDAETVLPMIPIIARAIRDALPIKGLNIVNNNGEIAGQTVLHSHFHFIPRYSDEDQFEINFTDNSAKVTKDDLIKLQNKLKNALN